MASSGGGSRTFSGSTTPRNGFCARLAESFGGIPAARAPSDSLASALSATARATGLTYNIRSTSIYEYTIAHANSTIVAKGLRPKGIVSASEWRFANPSRAIVHKIVTGTVAAKSRDGWVSIQHRDASELVGDRRSWDRLKRTMVNSDTIECDGVWRRGRKSMRYRLTPRWSEAGIVPFTLRDQSLICRLVRSEDAQSRRGDWLPVHRHLEHWLRQVEVDEKAARKWVCRPSSERQGRARKALDLIRSGDTPDVCFALRPSLLSGDLYTSETSSVSLGSGSASHRTRRLVVSAIATWPIVHKFILWCRTTRQERRGSLSI